MSKKYIADHIEVSTSLKVGGNDVVTNSLGYNPLNWDAAYNWGDHSLVGYLTSFTETDPIYTASSWYTTTNNSTNWNTAYTYSQVGHLPLAGGTLTGTLNGLGANFTDPVTIYDNSGSENPRLSVGRGATERLSFDVEDRVAKIYHVQDEGSGGHSMEFSINSPDPSKTFYWLGKQVDATSPSTYMTLNSNGNLTVAGSSRFGNILVGDGTYKNTIVPIDDTNLNINTPSGAVYFNTYTVANGSHRAPIFYDSNNTSYYVDPTSTTWSSYNLGGARFRNIQISSSDLTDTIQNVTAGGNLWLQYGHNGPIGLGYGGGLTTVYNGLTVNSGLSRLNGGIRLPDTNSTIDSMWGIYGWDTQLQFTKRNISTDAYEGTAMFIDYSGLYVQSDYSFRAPIFYDSNNTGYYVDPASKSNFTQIAIQGTSYYFDRNSSYFRWQSPSGYIDIGSGNTTWAHFYTDRPGYYFSSSNVAFDGNIFGYGGDETASFATYYDSNNTAYYIDPASTSYLNEISGPYFKHITLPNVGLGSSYDERVLLLIPKVETNNSYNNRIHGKVILGKTGGNVIDFFDIQIQSVYNATYASFTSTGQRSDHKFVTCTYNGIKWVAIKVSFTANPYNYAYFHGHAITDFTATASNDMLRLVSYYDTNGGGVLNSEIYNSIADYAPSPMLTKISNGAAGLMVEGPTYSDIFYDRNDTTYYLNPAGDSLVNSISIGAYSASSIRPLINFGSENGLEFVSNTSGAYNFMAKNGNDWGFRVETGDGSYKQLIDRFTYSEVLSSYVQGAGWAAFGFANSSISVYTSDYSTHINTGSNYVWGNMNVSGTFYAATKYFRIDHPLKPETHDLVHSAVESSRADVYYRGKSKLINGTVSVNIDEYVGMTEGTFEALTKDVQCFTTNEDSWVNVKGNVTGNILTILAQDTSCEDNISWLVFGERNDDAYINRDDTDENGRLILEPETEGTLEQRKEAFALRNKRKEFTEQELNDIINLRLSDMGL